MTNGGRDDQADNADRRQRERDVLAELERSDETEPPVDPATLESLSADLDAVDDDEGIGTVADWIVRHIDANGTLPGSRDVRRQAAKVCRANGYQVRNGEWLGV